jgi:hypothetical protein
LCAELAVLAAPAEPAGNYRTDLYFFAEKFFAYSICPVQQVLEIFIADREKIFYFGPVDDFAV